MTAEEIVLLRTCLQIGGILFIVLFLCIYYQSRKSMRWAMTRGKILSSSVSSCNMSGGVEKVYEAKIEYQYEVDEKLYSSKRAYHGDWLATSFSSYVKKMTKEYSLKPNCEVYYDPRKPQNAVLIKGIAPPIYTLLYGGLFFLAIDILLFVFKDEIIHFAFP